MLNYKESLRGLCVNEVEAAKARYDGTFSFRRRFPPWVDTKDFSYRILRRQSFREIKLYGVIKSHAWERGCLGKKEIEYGEV